MKEYFKNKPFILFVAALCVLTYVVGTNNRKQAELKENEVIVNEWNNYR